MLDRVVAVNVFDMIDQIVVVSDCVLPKTSLPDAAAAIRNARVTPWLFLSMTGEPCLGELLLDPCPSPGVITVVGGQRPDRMKVIWKQHDCVDRHRPFVPTVFDGCSQDVAGTIVAKKGFAVFRYDGEEERASWDVDPSIVGHLSIVSRPDGPHSGGGKMVRTADPTVLPNPARGPARVW